MAGIYVDTSAIGRVLLAEPEASAIRDLLTTHDTWWSSELLIVELRRLAARESLESNAEEYLEAFQLVPVDSPSIERASRVEPMTVRSLDAIHLEAALQLQQRTEIGAVVTYDHQLHAGCTHHGLAVHAPVAA